MAISATVTAMNTPKLSTVSQRPRRTARGDHDWRAL